jgi:hypothetical protein
MNEPGFKGPPIPVRKDGHERLIQPDIDNWRNISGHYSIRVKGMPL